MRARATYVDRVARRTKIIAILVVTVTGLITLSAVIDCAFGFGWGYHWSDAAYGFGIMLGQGLVYLFCRGIFRLIGSGS